MPPTKALDPPKRVERKIPCRVAPLEQPGAKASLAGSVARVYWMLAGNAALSLLAIGIVQHGRERTWVTDAAFWATFASLLLVRYVDITRLRGTTASGEPASIGDWYRYAGGLLLLSLTVWILAQAVAPMVSRSPSQ